MAFYQKYRPQNFSDVVGQDHVSKTLLTAIQQGKLSHAYLLSGPRGTGKTTTARLLAKAINCQKASGEPCNQCELCQSITAGRSLDVIEIDAASHTGVDDIRDIIDKARLAPSVAKKKVYIIDEVHMLSKSAFNALLKTLEEPPPHVVFILATTEVHKLPATILSRTQRYDFKRITRDGLVAYLRRVAEAEGIKADDQSLDLIAVLASGGHRDAVSLLEQIAGYTQTVTVADVENILGLMRGTKVFQFVEAIFNNTAEEGLKIAHEVFEEGADLGQFHREVLEVLRKTLVVKVCGRSGIEDTADNSAAIEKLAGLADQGRILAITEIFVANGRLMKEVANPVLPIEMAVVEATSISAKGREGERAKVESEPESIRSTKAIPRMPEATEKSHQIQDGGDLQNNNIKSNGLELVKAQVIDDQISSEVTMQVSKEVSSAPVLEMTADIWKQLIDETKKQNATLAALLRDAKPIVVSDGNITLAVKFKFHKDRISEVKNREILERIIETLMGAKYMVSCELIDARKPQQGQASDDELQKAVTEVFEVS